MPPWLLRFFGSVGILRPDRLWVPLTGQDLQGVTHLKADADLLVQRQDLRFRPFTWRVDSGAMITRISWDEADRLGFPTDEADPSVVIREKTAAGRREATIRQGIIRVLLHERQRAAPFQIPIWYVLDPCPIPLLGLGGVIHQLRWIIDGRERTGFLQGYCLLKDCRPVRERFPG
jgi:hypothetical protein